MVAWISGAADGLSFRQQVGFHTGFKKLTLIRKGDSTMSLKNHIRWQIEQCHWITMSYVQDLNDADLLLRPVPGMNHIAWQLGHLIASNQKMLGWLGQPGPALPSGFADGYTKETAGSDDSAKFATKDVYVDLAAKAKEASLAALDAIPENKLDNPGPEETREYAPTIAAVLTMLATHWLMHAGQFVAVRRKLGKAPLF
jgi:hypothetical protein